MCESISSLEKKLAARFGFNHFKPGQVETIQALLAGKDVLSVLPTGTGKSLCYQFSAYQLGVRTLIISPLISLMQDQVAQLQKNGEKKAVALHSFQSYTERQYILHHLADYQFIFMSPETALKKETLMFLAKNQIRLLVIDEAHCIVSWGKDFRPAYLRLSELREKLSWPQTLALTATATAEAQSEIEKVLKLSENSQLIQKSVDRPNIYLSVEQCADGAEKVARLLEKIAELKGEGIIYFSSKRETERIAELIHEKLKIPTTAYHGDLPYEERIKIQRQFLKHQLKVICATNAFGMGINKPDVRFVIHYHLPANVESYLQEIGRAGRDQQQSIAILLYAPGDEYLQKTLQIDQLPSEGGIRYFFKTPMRPKELQTESERVLEYYRSSGWSASQTVAQFEQISTHKQMAIQTMLRYIQLKTCRRKFLLACFNEKKESINSFCCDDEPHSLEEMHLDADPTGPSVTESPDWKTKIISLFSVKEA